MEYILQYYINVFISIMKCRVTSSAEAHFWEEFECQPLIQVFGK